MASETAGALPSVTAREQDPATIITYHRNPGPIVAHTPAVMSWAGQRALIGSNADVLEARHTDPPPDYSQPFVPTRPVKYTFSLIDNDAMLLMPPADALDSRPLYHISVSVNPFVPSMSTTTIRRGASTSGECVITFEWGSKRLTPWVTMGSDQIQRLEVFRRLSGFHDDSNGEYTVLWPGLDSHNMFWICNGHIATCYSSKGRVRPNLRTETPLAKFHGRTTLRNKGQPPSRPPITLLVDPNGHVGPRLDLIVMGALMIERSRDER